MKCVCKGATATSWLIWGTVFGVGRARQFVELDVFLFLFFSPVCRQKDKERKSRLSLFLTKSGSHENVSPSKKTNTTPSK